MATPRKRQSRKAPSKPSTPEPERTVKAVEQPPNEKVEITVETPVVPKYEKKEKVGTPKLGRSPNYVTSVGLGKLKVTTAHGNIDV